MDNFYCTYSSVTIVAEEVQRVYMNHRVYTEGLFQEGIAENLRMYSIPIV